MVEMLAPRGGRILDVGCADGFLLRRLPEGFERYGIEMNAAAAAKAAAAGITVLGADISDPAVLSDNPGSFDIVTSMATFEHVLDLRGAVRDCIGLLRPRGVLLFEVPLISDAADNRDWFHGSYEHIHYPTVRGLERLFAGFADMRFLGFESEIAGFSSTYIGAGTRDPKAFGRLLRLFGAMRQPGLEGLDTAETRLNLAYHVVHGVRPTPERIAALPVLFEVAATPNLLRRLTQLWEADRRAAAAAGEVAAAAQWHEGQARAWETACQAATLEAETLRQRARAAQEETEGLRARMRIAEEEAGMLRGLLSSGVLSRAGRAMRRLLGQSRSVN